MIRHLTVCAVLSCAAGVRADDDPGPPHVVYDRERGELSPGTDAPKRDNMVNAIKSASPTRLYATLEYGERVECFECIPLLADKLLQSSNSQTREIAAWWLRRRSFGFGAVMVKMQNVATSDSDPEQRARAAQALGEFLDPHGEPTLSQVATQDSDASVRAAALRALGRLNVITGQAAISRGFSDSDASVRQAALDQVLKVNFFHDTDALLGTLSDSDAGVRRTAAQLAGERRITGAVEPLLGLVMTDADAQVRQAAVIALGHIGGADASAALADAKSVEKNADVLVAIDIASKMH